MIGGQRRIGHTMITSKNQISLPAASLRALGWGRGDQLLVQVVGDDALLLMRRPQDWVAAFSGKMADVFGDHEDTLSFLDGERRSWEPGANGDSG
jgi:bifunctional DNA-binding transcriptional regulator/antitoxin component of YhaV-PrlF toxin-antitoxin module